LPHQLSGSHNNLKPTESEEATLPDDDVVSLDMPVLGEKPEIVETEESPEDLQAGMD
jgi:hypothetical protein